MFFETPCDLQYQCSTWSNYKHHNTAKFIVACTPNGAISFVSPLYVGSISDVELTRVSGFIESWSGKTGVSIMAALSLLTNSHHMASSLIFHPLWRVEPNFPQRMSEKAAKLHRLGYTLKEPSGE